MIKGKLSVSWLMIRDKLHPNQHITASLIGESAADLHD